MFYRRAFYHFVSSGLPADYDLTVVAAKAFFHYISEKLGGAQYSGKIIIIGFFISRKHISYSFKRHAVPEIKNLLPSFRLYGIFPEAVENIFTGKKAEKPPEVVYKLNVFFPFSNGSVVKAAYYLKTTVIAVFNKIIVNRPDIVAEAHVRI